MTPSKHALEHPQVTAGGGGSGSRRRRSCARAGGVRSHRSGRNIHSDCRSCGVLRLDVGYLMVLQEFPFYHPLDHHDNLWGIPTTVKSCPRNADDLLKNEVKN
jgi:hypothetical protein